MKLGLAPTGNLSASESSLYPSLFLRPFPYLDMFIFSDVCLPPHLACFNFRFFFLLHPISVSFFCLVCPCPLVILVYSSKSLSTCLCLFRSSTLPPVSSRLSVCLFMWLFVILPKSSIFLSAVLSFYNFGLSVDLLWQLSDVDVAFVKDGASAQSNRTSSWQLLSLFMFPIICIAPSQTSTCFKAPFWLSLHRPLFY